MNRLGAVLCVLLFAIGIVSAGCGGYVSATNPGAPLAPSITTQPVSQTVTTGQTATFTVVAAGTAPLSYQWRKSGTAISGATASSYTTPATTSADNGSQFTVVVSNTAGSVTSNAATLTVSAAAVAPSITTQPGSQDRKSTRLNSSHLVISYAVFCLKKKKKQTIHRTSLTTGLNEQTRAG